MGGGGGGGRDKVGYVPNSLVGRSLRFGVLLAGSGRRKDYKGNIGVIYGLYKGNVRVIYIRVILGLCRLQV